MKCWFTLTHSVRDAAAEVLKDFAAAGGHQMFVFTCHKHLVSLFTEMGADVRLLPDTPQQGKAKIHNGSFPGGMSGS